MVMRSAISIDGRFRGLKTRTGSRHLDIGSAAFFSVAAKGDHML